MQDDKDDKGHHGGRLGRVALATALAFTPSVSALGQQNSGNNAAATAQQSGSTQSKDPNFPTLIGSNRLIGWYYGAAESVVPVIYFKDPQRGQLFIWDIMRKAHGSRTVTVRQ